MKENLQLTTRQQMQQRLMPMQVQYGRMLEMNTQEVEEEVKRALEEFPALEAVDDSHHASATEDGGEAFTETAEEMQRADYRNDDEMPTLRLEAYNHHKNLRQNDRQGPEPVVANDGETLLEALDRQLSELNLDDRQMLIARYIAGNIDDNGYLTRSAREIADDLAFQQGVEVDAGSVGRLIEVVQSLDPAGVGAVDLRQCLLLQLKRLTPTPDVERAREIVEHYFDLLSKLHYDRLTSALGLSREELRGALNVIERLDPKPGRQFAGSAAEEASRLIIPDFAVEADGDHLTVTALNNIPELQLEATFRADTMPAGMGEGSSERARKEAATFMKQKRDEAQNFINLLAMRQSTLMRIMTAITRLQRDFFMTGDPSKLRPMILKDVAAITGDDLSVISRATAGKYVATRQGIWPVKSLFNESTGIAAKPKEEGDETDEATSATIIATIRAIIGDEDPRHPMSDEQITRRLQAEGIEIARRTVAKYRERLGYPVARLRKKL